MYLDAFTISALVDEFLDTLVGGRVQDSVSVDELSLGLEIYAHQQRRYLYLSADAQTPRIHIVSDKLRRGAEKPSQVGLLVRRYVEGGIIEHVSQPVWERIVQIDVRGQEGDVSLIVEPMERRSNIILARDGVIVDCLRRVGADENRFRVILPAHEYVPPPPQIGKLDPTRLTLESLLGIFQQNDDPKRKTHQLLTGRLLGFSPLLAKEVVFRAGGGADQRAGEVEPARLFDAIRAVVTPLARREWQPGIAETEDGVLAYSVYPLESLSGWRPIESVSAALEAFYGAPVGEEAYNAGKAVIREEIKAARLKLNAKLASLERSMTDDAERETLRQSGELILAYQYTLAPGQTELRAQYDLDKPELVVKLDATLTPLENAQRYFEKYGKAKRALEDVPGLIEDTRTELAFLAQLETDLDLAANWLDIDEVQQALQAKGYWRGKLRARMGGSGRSAPLRVVTPDGFVIWLGRNSRQNEIVTFDKGSPQDLWLHVRDAPGAHVIVKNDGRRIPNAVIEQAGGLAAYYSALRGEVRAPVDVTYRKYVRKIRGGAVGMVTYRNEETRMVAPRSEKD